MYCERIVRGINPAADVSLSEMNVLDLCSLAGNECACSEPEIGKMFNLANRQLSESLPHSLNKDSAIQNGWWFHYLVDKAPGWWNNNGKEHVYFSDVIAFAIGAEMGNIRDYKVGDLIAQAIANKGWQEGFYRMLGGRQSVTTRVFNAIYSSPDMNGDRWYKICGRKTAVQGCVPFGQVASQFAGVLSEISLNVNDYEATRGLGRMVLWNSSWRSNIGNPNSPYEWGNVTEYTRKTHPNLIAALNKPVGSGIDQALYHTSPLDVNQFFVISQSQANRLCNNQSCVAP